MDDENLKRVTEKIFRGFNTIERFIDGYGELLSKEDLNKLKDKIKILEISANTIKEK